MEPLKVQLEMYKSFWEPKKDSTLSFLPRFNELLSQGEPPFFRCHLPGHFTASAFVFDASFSRILLMHHAKLNKWLQPGGHADGELNLWEAAKRELEEETGLKEVSLLTYGAPFDSPLPLDIDIHEIPATKKEGRHEHFDVRFAFTTKDIKAIRGNSESLGLKWFSLPHYFEEQSMHRTVEKAKMLDNAFSVFD